MASEVFAAMEASPRQLDNAMGKESRSAANLRLYRAYANDPDYKDVYFDSTSGGMTAVHKGHNWEHNSSDTMRFFDGMTKEDLEKEFAMEVVRMGGSAIMQDESRKRADGTKLPALDVKLNGILTDVRSVTERTDTYKNHLDNKKKQLTKWNRENPNNKSRTITLYFHDPSMFSEKKMSDTLNEVRRYRRNYRYVKVVVRGAERIRTYRV